MIVLICSMVFLSFFDINVLFFKKFHSIKAGYSVIDFEIISGFLTPSLSFGFKDKRSLYLRSVSVKTSVSC